MTADRRLILFMVLVAAVALAVKAAHLQQRRALPDYAYPALDAKFHEDWAAGLATGDWTPEMAELRAEPFFRAPLYPYLMAAVYRLFGHAPGTLLTIQIIIGSLSAALVFGFTWIVFNPRTAWLAALLSVGYWPLTYFDAERMIPVLVVFLDLSLMLAIIRAGRSGKRTAWALAGILLGISAIARPNILAVVPFVLLWLFVRTAGAPRPARLRSAAVFCTAALLAVLPVTFHNIVRGGDLVFIASQGGVNFYIGNNPGSDGVRAVVPGTRADWWGGYHDTRSLAEDAAGKPLQPSAVSRYWYRQGLDFWIREPALAARLYVRKLGLLFGNGEVSNNEQLYFRREQSSVLSALPVTFALLLALSILGLIIVWRDGKTGDKTQRTERLLGLYLAVPYALSILLFFVTSRYRLPVVVFLMPVAAYGLSALVAAARGKDWPSLAKRAALVLALLFVSSLNPHGVGRHADSRGYYSLGVAWANTDYSRALSAFNKSLAADSSFAPAWRMRGWTLDKLGEFAAASRDLAVSTALDSTNTDAFYTLGVVYQKLDRHAEAGRAYQQVLTLEPSHVRALNNVAEIYMRAEEYEKAKSYLDRALQIDPDFDNAIYGLGYYFEKTDNDSAAIDAYARILHYPAARARLVLLFANRGEIDRAIELLHSLESHYPDASELRRLRPLLRELRERRDG